MTTRQWVSTETPEARREITYAVRTWLDAEPERNRTLRKHYAAGVDPRDLLAIVRDAGWSVTEQHLARLIRGARDEQAPETA